MAKSNEEYNLKIAEAAKEFGLFPVHVHRHLAQLKIPLEQYVAESRVAIASQQAVATAAVEEQNKEAAIAA